jgi:hypothetical protein
MDYFCLFASQAAAEANATVGAYYVPASADGPGGWRGDVVFPGLKVVTPSAIVNGISTLTGFWLMIATQGDNAVLDSVTNCVMKLDRDVAVRGYTPGVPSAPVVISSITYAGSTATVTTATAHGLKTNSVVSLTGQTPAAYSGGYQVTVTGADTFTYAPSLPEGTVTLGSATVMGSYAATLPATSAQNFVSAATLTGAGRTSLMFSPVPAGSMYPQPLGQ